jgi:hypothetical protein
MRRIREGLLEISVIIISLGLFDPDLDLVLGLISSFLFRYFL